MGKFDGILICTDCDGTLTNSEVQISDENSNAIKYFQEQGGRFTLATGRFPQHAYNFSDKIKVNAPVISLNGVWVYDLETEQTIGYSPMKSKEAFEVMDYINQNWKGVWEYWLNFNGSESACYKPLEDRFESESLKTDIDFKKKCDTLLSQHTTEEKKVFEYIQTVLPEETAKIVFVMPEEMLRLVQSDLKNKFGDRFNFDSSWPNGLEMQWIESGKGKAVQLLREHLGDIKTVVCVGDYDNDLSMLKIADISYAVANAIDEVKQVADRVTVSNNDNAIARIVKDLDKEFK